MIRKGGAKRIMKTLLIGDLHLMAGLILPLVETHTENIAIDHIILTGDYTDQWGQNNNPSLYFKDLQFLYDWKTKKESQGIKVTCLLGNHDIPYLIKKPVHYSLLWTKNQLRVRELLLKLRPQLSFYSDEFLISHGGYLGDYQVEDWHLEPLPDNFCNYNINHYLWTQLRSIVQNAGYCRGGTRQYGSPVWADAIEEFSHFPSKNYLRQCVGHRPVPKITTFTQDNAELIAIDTFSLTPTMFWPYYHPRSATSGVTILENMKNTVIPIPEWNELPENTYIRYFEETE